MRHALLFLSIFVMATAIQSNQKALAGCPIPNVLNNGTTADAAQVMGNFTSIGNCATRSSLFDLSQGVPSAASFTALNLSSGTSLTDQSPNALYMVSGSSAVNSLSIEYKGCPTPPYRIAILVQTLWVGVNN